MGWENCESWQMKTVFILFAAFLMIGCVDKDDTVSGRFIGTQKFGIGQVDSPITIEIHQEGNNITGSITPPFSNQQVSFKNGLLQGTTVQFDRTEGNITFHYEIVLSPAKTTLQGNFQPIGCIDPQSGESCQTDSNGSFTAEKR
jgi:hypothetical protein